MRIGGHKIHLTGAKGGCRPVFTDRNRGISLLLSLCLLVSCSQEKSLRIRTSFIESQADELLSDDPDRLDRYNCAIVIEYPDSIIGSNGVNHPILCDTLKNKILDVIFGHQAAAEARADALAPSPRWREGDNAFVRQVKVLTDDFNHRRHLRYPAARDTLRGDLLYEIDINGYVAGTWREYVSYHIFIKENEFGKVKMLERGYNYDKDGHLVREAELFKEGWEQALSTLLTAAFRHHHTTRSLPLNEDAVRPNGNFKFSPGGIIWMYDEGEIAPPEYGILRVNLPWKVIEDYSSVSLSR